ncbi:MAG: GNAT family N-acetyltransferase [Clostridia bacterium]
MNIEIKKLMPDMAEEYVHFFNTTPHNHKHNMKCYCICWCSNVPEGFDVRPEADFALKFVRNGNLQGYFAYSEGKVIGWVNANTKSECLNCLGWKWSRTSYPTDSETDKHTKSIFCFTVAPEFQRKSITTQLLERVYQDAKHDGFRFVEAYPDKILTKKSEGLLATQRCMKNSDLPCL